ncbi:fasciclin domain-containing protein [Spirosoma taeanense]|uniref:Fasciclin domain-containing protein n=1 Tax=Spirosoma taeanense TaxID=2735870 RepID=A0A6M5Y3S8_9BACT|nr:fasciclin domain-containing protein [Spirosoma taeanense]QJW88030.1 fasciclin domain-containing protein [Spirosoma taeanense]
MTNSFSLYMSRLALFVLVLTFSLSCQKNDDTIAEPKTITDLVLEDSRFSLLRAAVNHAGVGDVLKGANLTFFAPNDAAFQASGLTTMAAITALPKEQLKTALLYHILYSPVFSATIPSGLNSVETASKGVAFINKTSNDLVYINNARVTEADIQAANGVIHVINRVLTPSGGNLMMTIQNNPNLTFLAAAVKRISLANPAFLAALNNSASTNPLTFFAPTNDAFRAAGYSSVSAVEAAAPQTLIPLLSYHVVSGINLSYQLQNGSVNTLLNGNRMTVAVNNGVITVKGNRNSTPATVRTPDVITTNGVMHIIDQVLQP